MTSALLQFAPPVLSPEVEPLDIRPDATGSFLVVIAPTLEATSFLFEYMAVRQSLEGYGFGSVGQNNPRQPILVWLRARRRRTWIREYIWSALEIEEMLVDVWGEVGAEFAPVPMPVAALAPPPPPIEVKPGMRSLVQMAAEMKLPPAELYDRLESGEWDYKVSRQECWDRQQGDAYGVLTQRNEYMFNKAAAEHNVKNKDKKREIKSK